MELKEALEKIDSESSGYFQVERGSEFGRKLADSLSEKGWENAEMYTSCSKASFERKLSEPDTDKVVYIASAYFMGPFTEVKIFSENW